MNRPFRVRLPGFLVEDETGLGDVIKRVTAAVGVRPCGGCERRAQSLNRRVVFTEARPSTSAPTPRRESQ
jgi:hypothetical protein